MNYKAKHKSSLKFTTEYPFSLEKAQSWLLQEMIPSPADVGCESLTVSDVVHVVVQKED